MSPDSSEARATHAGPVETAADASSLRIPVLSEDGDTLDAAFAYAKAGWHVLPVLRGQKNPGSVVGKDWPRLSSRDPMQLVAWWSGTDHGIALHAGRSGAVIFDVDHPEALPELLALHLDGAPYQSTRTDEPGRGHYVFAVPAGSTLGNGTGALGKGWGEVRGTNGVIICAPSVHEKAEGRYAWEVVGPVPVLPVELLDALPTPTGTPTNAATDAQVEAFLDRHTGSTDPAMLQGPLTRYADDVAAGGSRHEAALSVTCWAMREAAEGRYSAREAAEKIGQTFGESLAADRGRSPRSEWAGILAWAVAQVPPPPEPEPAPEPMSLDECHKIYRHWLGESYDLGALDVVLACAAVEQLGGDPVWLLMVSGSGNAKTETIGALQGAGAYVTSTVSSEGALLSATSAKDKAKDATGGLLRKIGPRGLLVIKDFTSILSMNRDSRATVLAALREVYDGKWERNVGTDGGKTLTWSGRLVVIGATTSKYDAAHEVICHGRPLRPGPRRLQPRTAGLRSAGAAQRRPRGRDAR